ncbi:hypothetical protein J3Q64DRAFT_1479471 [Phycomyces blakesleeanus]|uniref:Uncharacterized protein n=1 Tax=Phycomyces blakesleeanus TaxID=4837 RepID=A0ABR3B0W9_PHYBL
MILKAIIYILMLRLGSPSSSWCLFCSPPFLLSVLPFLSLSVVLFLASEHSNSHPIISTFVILSDTFYINYWKIIPWIA